MSTTPHRLPKPPRIIPAVARIDQPPKKPTQTAKTRRQIKAWQKKGSK